MPVYVENTAVFEKFKALSIQNVEDLVIGETYYSNLREPFKVLEIISWKELESRKNGKNNYHEDDNEPAWIITGPDIDQDYESLSDNNIGASYNPWLIFKDKETAELCKEELKVGYAPDPSYDDWEDYDYYDVIEY